jgi:soluble lytic murein transglycosylase-like protein
MGVGQRARGVHSHACHVRGVTFALSLLSLIATTVRAEMYYYRDDEGAYHFTNAPRPGAARFVFDQPLADLSSTPATLAATGRGFAPWTAKSPDQANPRPVAARAQRGRGAAAQRAFGAAAYDEVIAEYAERYQVDPALVRAVIHAESGFDRLAISSKGARGLMQLMPATARERGCRNPFDPDDNVHAGVEQLRVLLDEHGKNLPRALAAYNAGSNPVARYRGIPPYAETEQYVARVLRLRRDYLRKQRLAR